MKYRNIFWGVIFVAIGILFLLKGFRIIWFDWYMILSLWPVLLILLGISIIPIKNYIKLILSFLTIALTLVYIFNTDNYRYYDFKFKKNYYDYDNRWTGQNLYEPYDSTFDKAVLKIDAGAGFFTIYGTTDSLIEVEKQGDVCNYILTTRDNVHTKILKLKLQDLRFHRHHNKNKVFVSLNANPLWDFDFDVGAADIALDLSMFKTNNIKIDGGASAIKLKLGDKYEKTNLNIDAGASSIIIKIPEESACQIRTNTFLSSKYLKGFNKIDRHLYRTNGFSENKQKIFIDVDAAVSSLKIKKY